MLFFTYVAFIENNTIFSLPSLLTRPPFFFFSRRVLLVSHILYIFVIATKQVLESISYAYREEMNHGTELILAVHMMAVRHAKMTEWEALVEMLRTVLGGSGGAAAGGGGGGGGGGRRRRKEEASESEDAWSQLLSSDFHARQTSGCRAHLRCLPKSISTERSSSGSGATPRMSSMDLADDSREMEVEVEVEVEETREKEEWNKMYAAVCAHRHLYSSLNSQCEIFLAIFCPILCLLLTDLSHICLFNIVYFSYYIF